MSTGWNVVEGNAGARKCLLNRRWDAIGVAVGGDVDGATIVHLDECPSNILGDGMRVTTLWNLAVLYVPPY